MRGDIYEFSSDETHPGKQVRIEAFMRGFSRIDRGKEAARLKVFEGFSPYDLEGIYPFPARRLPPLRGGH